MEQSRNTVILEIIIAALLLWLFWQNWGAQLFGNGGTSAAGGCGGCGGCGGGSAAGGGSATPGCPGGSTKTLYVAPQSPNSFDNPPPAPASVPQSHSISLGTNFNTGPTNAPEYI
jgi:hypothetical protein